MDHHLPTAMNKTYTGILLAIIAVIIWSGNFIVSRGVSTQIGPVQLAFYRWLTATVILAPFAWKKCVAEFPIIRANLKYLFWVSLTGITLFNTCVYVAGHYTTAINLALIGTTSSPIFATIIAVIFLKEKISGFRLAGMITCIAGIILLISKGNLQTLMGFRFSKGDLWVMAGALAFAVYSVLVRSKPKELSSLSFLFTVFAMGFIMLLVPFFIEWKMSEPVQWNHQLIGVILYLGIGASIISFLSWNLSIQKLGAARTVLFGNLIPIFSTLEAVWLLNESIGIIHIISGILVITGLILANTQKKIKQTV